MKSFDSRVYNISDFAEWRSNGLLDLSPDFQRRSVWSLKAKAYLIDTIIRGKPIPKILITQTLKSRRNVRIVVDGQQRMRAILEYLEDAFPLSRAHNREFAGCRYGDLPPDLRDDFMQYEVSVDLLFNVPYEDLLDIFARINTYTVKLNKQEILNAKYLGYFKTRAYTLGYRYVTYFLESKVLSKPQVSRMAEAELASDLLVALCGGVQTNKTVENFYKRYEDDPSDIEQKAERFESVMTYVGAIYAPEDLANTNWRRIHLFYTLFTVIGHAAFGLQNLDNGLRFPVSEQTLPRLRVGLDDLSTRYDRYTTGQVPDVPAEFRQFIEWSRRGTTDTSARVGRAEFVCKEIKKHLG
jgi:Protein of unknown function DUF262